MKYLKIKEIAKIWHLSERTIRNYCYLGKIKDVKKIGKIYYIPFLATPPRKLTNKNTLLTILKEQKEIKLKGGIYHKAQVEFAYNSNHIEGSKLTYDETRYIYETNTIGPDNKNIYVNDIIETINHFRCFDYIIDKASFKLTEKFIKELHKILKTNTVDSNKNWFKVGEYKQFPNEVGGYPTTSPENVRTQIIDLLNWYNGIEIKTLENIIDFHYKFEKIHPFQDGNGRVGRLIMFKECLKNNITPFIISEDLKFFYYRGLKKWDEDNKYLIDTLLTAQDIFKK